MKTGVLITNLGTPEAPDSKAVRKYLAEFLSDPDIIKLPRPLWWLILNGIILPTRPKKSAKAYAKIWTAEGSPLLVQTKRITDALQEKFKHELNLPIHITYAMRYGMPSIQQALNEFRKQDIKHLIILPLYPQYSTTTTGSTTTRINKLIQTNNYKPKLTIIKQ